MAVKSKTQTALVGGPDGQIVLSSTASRPDGNLHEHEIAVEVKAISLNPVDTKMTGGYHTQDAILGCDYSGVVTEVGSLASEKWGYKVGDRVAATILGMNPLTPNVGAFAEHSVCTAWGAQKIPEQWSFAEGAGGLGGLAWTTVSWALFDAMGLPAGPQLEPLNTLRPPAEMLPKLNLVTSHNPGDGSRPLTTVLVSGGASYTGTAAIQLLKLAGFNVIATCAARSFDLVKSFGASEVFDYASPTVTSDIRTYTRNSLRLIIDCITTPDTTTLCYAAMGRAGGRYVALDPFSDTVAETRGVVRPSWVFGVEPLGGEIAWPAPHGRPANSDAQNFLEIWNPTMAGIVKRGLVRFHPQLIRDGGLEGALQGLDDLRSKRVAGKKLIYTI